jgi:hypothetical protein
LISHGFVENLNGMRDHTNYIEFFLGEDIIQGEKIPFFSFGKEPTRNHIIIELFRTFSVVANPMLNELNYSYHISNET